MKILKTLLLNHGNSDLIHNNCDIYSETEVAENNTDMIVLLRIPIATAYEKCFGEAVREYNRLQTRNDRKIKDYFSHTFRQEPTDIRLRNANGQLSYYECFVQLGDNGYANVADESEKTIEVLTEYAMSFQERHPNFYVFNSVIHKDGSDVHLHLNYIPFGHYPQKKLKVQNSHTRALIEMGYDYAKFSIQKWRDKERLYIRDLCEPKNIAIAAVMQTL